MAVGWRSQPLRVSEILELAVVETDAETNVTPRVQRPIQKAVSARSLVRL